MSFRRDVVLDFMVEQIRINHARRETIDLLMRTIEAMSRRIDLLEKQHENK